MTFPQDGDGRSLITLSTLDDSISFTLPVTPEEIDIIGGHNIKKHDIISSGVVAQLGPKRAIGVRFSSFFPEFIDSYINRVFNYNLDYPVVKADLSTFDDLPTEFTQPFLGQVSYIKNPIAWVRVLEEIQSQPLYLFIDYPLIHGKYLVSEFTYRIIGGEGKDIRYTLGFIQAREQSVKSADDLFIDKYIRNDLSTRFSTFDKTTYIVTENDTLERISRITDIPVSSLVNVNAIRDSSVDLFPGRVIYLERPTGSNVLIGE